MEYIVKTTDKEDPQQIKKMCHRPGRQTKNNSH